MSARWSYRDGQLLWLFVAAFAIHITEEWFGGFPVWVRRVVSQPMPETAFLIINAVVMALLIAGVRAATRSERSGWVAVAVATIALVNTLAHLGGVFITGDYAPGVISAVILYIPLGALTLARAFDQAPRSQVVSGVVSGVLLHAALLPVAFAATRWG